jgi:hypothetical protein
MSGNTLGGNKKRRKVLDEDRDELLVARRGRPTEFSDEQLHARRDQFAVDFDGAWADIGWELSQCTEPSEITGVFDSLPDKRDGDLFSTFRHPSGESPDGKKLRELRSVHRALGKPAYLVGQSKREIGEKLQLSALALKIATKRQREIAKRNLKAQRKEAPRVEQAYRNLADVQKSSEQQIKLLQATGEVKFTT